MDESDGSPRRPAMTPHLPVDAQVSYLLVFPTDATQLPQPPERIERLKDPPYFEAVDVDIRTIAHHVVDVGGSAVALRHQIYDGLIEVAEGTFTLPDALSLDALQVKAQVQAALRARLTARSPGGDSQLEEYTVLLVKPIDCPPDEFIDQHGQALARFIRSQREVFGPHEMEDILTSRVRYSDQELTLVDWEGAVVIAPSGDFQSDIELLKIGNYQLLRYRLLDQAIERNLKVVSQHLAEGRRPPLIPNRSKRVLQEALEQRLALMLDFEKTDQSLLLIGDWYTAKLYQLIYDEFYLDEWKAVIKNKLESLESITQIIQDNFTFSWSRFLELMQIAGWLLLLIGYFVLFFLDLRAYQ
ncbi:MAG TPA: hypothetical protein VJG32_05950 [Anaerolineae bacterium]|nr:hypothetical protein [Anaerolineae bacterium]